MDLPEAYLNSPGFIYNILSSIRHALIITDIEGKLLFTNQTAKEMLRTTQEDCRGESLCSFFTPEDMSCLYPNLLTMAHADRDFEGELMLMRKNGSRFFAYMVFRPYIVPAEGSKLIIVSIQDIDEKKGLQKSVENTRYEDLIKVADGIAHELRNPLVGIGGFVKRLYKSCRVSPEHDKYYDYIIKNLEKIENLVRKVKFFVKLPDPSFSRQNTNELVSKALKDHMGEIEKRQIVLKLNIENITLFVDADLIVRVISILIENALDALHSKGIITITGQINDNIFNLSISDSGRGITPGDLPYIFNPFFTTKAHGSGIDLAVAKRIVERHGGQINATSIEGEQSTFLVSFPLERRRAIRATRFDSHIM